MTTELISTARNALETFHKLRGSRTTFDQFSADVDCLLISVSSLDREPTRQLINEYLAGDLDGTRLAEVKALTRGLQSIVEPLTRLRQSSASAFHHTSKRQKNTSRSSWLHQCKDITARGNFAIKVDKLDELWSKFNLQAAHLNTFMTRLTQMQLQRQTELLTLRLAEQSLLKDNWRYSKDLINGTAKFRQDMARYIEYLRRDGRPFTEVELAERKRLDGQEVTFTRRTKSAKCSACARPIPVTTPSYRCASGRCTSPSSQDFRLCNGCYVVRGERCPGRDRDVRRGGCPRMERVGMTSVEGRRRVDSGYY